MKNRIFALIIGIACAVISIFLFFQSSYQESFVVPVLGFLLAGIGVVVTAVSASIVINRHAITLAIGVVLLAISALSGQTNQSNYNAVIGFIGIYLSVIGPLMFLISLGLLARDMTIKQQSVLVIIGIVSIAIALILSDAFPSYYQYGSTWGYYVIPTVVLVLGLLGTITAVVPTCIISVMLLMQGQSRPVASVKKAPKSN